jgi:hypothetical protein
VAVTDPPPLVAVKVYVVVAAGVTVTVPFGTTVPTPASIVTVAASVVVQDKVLAPPAVIDVGLADNDAVGSDTLSIATNIAADVAALPASSLAIAVSVWVPLLAAVVFQLTV